MACSVEENPLPIAVFRFRYRHVVQVTFAGHVDRSGQTRMENPSCLRPDRCHLATELQLPMNPGIGMEGGHLSAAFEGVVTAPLGCNLSSNVAAHM
ncbi:Hypothetical protein SMAX5B_019361 [Scophthalmus maximus]|uniref:Uncharacterized protein n=1 Tax=Scophthalmus maximus TaxID=52904 RepID=A0A2U9B7P6_SCOMX|nr:Hypothetical protein SMAX5B_019361 [Scophthalmus maximus]